tara:strand:+ start:14 stop:355 length:342 start_codon:yes stop_codon:yes gene_type:complete
MATTYEWNCRKVDIHPNQDEEANVVYNVHWIVTGVSDQLDTEGNHYKAKNIGSQVVPLDPETEFIPFDSLTNEIVTEWTKDSLGAEGVSSIEVSIEAKIKELINPTSLTLTIG